MKRIGFPQSVRSKISVEIIELPEVNPRLPSGSRFLIGSELDEKRAPRACSSISMKSSVTVIEVIILLITYLGTLMPDMASIKLDFPADWSPRTTTFGSGIWSFANPRPSNVFIVDTKCLMP